MITTCVASTDRYLTTTSFVKSLIGTTATSDDAVISAQILAASKWAETYLGYPLTVQTYQETLAGYGRRVLRLYVQPLRSMLRFLEGSTATSEANELYTTDRGYRIDDKEAAMLSRTGGFSWTAGGVGPGGFGWGGLFTGPYEAVPLSAFTPLPGEEERSYVAEYIAGWTLSGLTTDSPNWSTCNGGTTSTGRTLPEDIELAVAQRVRQIRDVDPSLTSESLGDVSASYRSASADQNEQNYQQPEGLLSQYRRII